MKKKNVKVSGKIISGKIVLICLGALVSIVFLILKKAGAGFLSNVRFNTVTGLCAALPIVFYLNRRTEEGVLCSFSMLIVEVIHVIVILGGSSPGLKGLFFILLSTVVIALSGIAVSAMLKKSTPYSFFIPVAFAALVLGFSERMLFYALIMLDESFSFGNYVKIITSSFSSVVFWIVVLGQTILAAVQKGPVEQLTDKKSAKKEKPESNDKVKKERIEKIEVEEKSDGAGKKTVEKPQKRNAIETKTAKEREPEPELEVVPEPEREPEHHDIYPEAVGGCRKTSATKGYIAPDSSLLKKYDTDSGIGLGTEDEQADAIESCLKEYGVELNFLQSVCGPSFTRYEFGVGSGVQMNKITSREKELSYALCGKKIRILAPIPGKKAIGIEVPNDDRAIVGFGNALEKLKGNRKFKSANVPMILGVTVEGDYTFTDVSVMPHMVIAGTTGSGKSVCINSLLISILFTKGPEQVRLILVDPKYVEMGIYDGIPHLLLPVITDMSKVLPMLEWLISEMERRYKLLSGYKVRDIIGMNSIIEEKHLDLEKLPYIVTVIDEVADLMSTAGKEVDAAVSRLAAKARAVGIHLVLATQRPSADVITGTLKSNLPGRIAFAVSSGVNSKIILDQQGAENLLGKGDMLFLDPAEGELQRIQGVLITGDEVSQVVSFLQEKRQGRKPRKTDTH